MNPAPPGPAPTPRSGQSLPPSAPPSSDPMPDLAATREARRAELLRDREVAAARRRRRGLALRAPSSMPVPEPAPGVEQVLDAS